MLPMNNEIPSSMYEAGKKFVVLGMRWKLKKNSAEIRKDVPAKVLWYFPPITRFRRMFQSAKITKDLTWHAHERDSNGTMCHPADFPSWKLVDHKWPDFAAEPRNLRLAISADGINPHSSLSSRYSCWPVIMITSNLSPWLCMKRKFMMLSLLISGPQQPGNSIDVYMAPLIDGLKMLWEVGVEAYDTYKEEHFRLKAILLWTINDFLALGNLSGCTMKGYYKKKSLFFDLEYWKYLHVRHNLDVMPIKKNVCESLIGMLLNIPGKTKDGINSHIDLVEMGLHEELVPQIGEKRTYLPPACYTLFEEKKKRVCTTLLELKVPEGYFSNFGSHVSMQDLKLYGLKSHYCHGLMQQLLLMAIRFVLPTHVRHAIIRLCLFFNAICSKVVDVGKLDEIQKDLVVTLCLLEKYLPPSFFDIMVHLTVHLVREVRFCEPVYFRWMYQFERFMKILKGYVCNRNCPEGCTAESYIV
ncbi:uncharacterized protein LOC114309984 [Camellia sinensis]|uniref:uncharacterized protein LOC114309984 n=1 Tax=Camellia sinensis TaxID=4442 RepID=UPI001036B4FE|nr:uncharacterized protein LOC114309984 [Camellia sinensis]